MENERANPRVKWLAAVAFLAVMGAALWYLARWIPGEQGGRWWGGEGEAPGGMELTVPKEVSRPPSGEEMVKVFDVTARDGVFEPSRLVLKKGDKVQVNFYAADGEYDMAVAAPIGAHVKAKKGKTAAFGFEAGEAGTYEFTCQDFCPPAKEMRGEFVVVP